MSEAVMVAIITGGISLVGTMFTILAASKKTDERLKVSQAVMNEKIETLTREVREHNNFAQRVPVLEEKVKSANYRLENLEAR